MLKLPLSTIERIIAVHDAAHDRGASSATLAGVLIARDTENGFTITATDGKIIVEESYPVESGTLAASFIVSKGSVVQLKDWCKAVRKSMPKARGISASFTEHDGRKLLVTVDSCVVGPLTLLGVDGTYPNYGGCFANRQEADANGNMVRAARMSFDSRYLARFERLWGEKGSWAIVMDFRHRGVVVSPLNDSGEGQRRGLIMPIIIPA